MTNPTLSGEPGTFKVQGSIVPTISEYYDLGSTSNRWKDLFLSGNTIHLGTTSLSTDPVTGGLVVATPTSVQPITGGGDSVWSQSSTNLYITGSNVGIGKTDPQKPLDVVGDVGVNGTLYITGNVMSIKATSNISSDAQFLGQAADSATAPSFSFIANSNTGIFQPASSNIAISTGGIERLRVTANGNVGIGTTNPLNKLDILGTIKATSFVGDGSLLTGITSSGSSSTSQWSQSGSNVYIVGSNVGIGTTNPQKPLDIVGDFQAMSVYQSSVSYSYDHVWTTRTSAADNGWHSIAWAPELPLFVAVAYTGHVMTSPDGITWTSRTAANSNAWVSVTWASGLSLFVAVSETGAGNRVMTSPDGITWTARTSAADNQWYSVKWAPELSLLVVVAASGAGNRVMTSPNGITWTAQTSAADNAWISLTWAPELSLFVAVASTGTGNRVMTSPNGINWTARTSAANNEWRSVTWAPELSLFVAVAQTGTGNRVMTSPDGINWTSRTSAADNSWHSVTWAPEVSLFVAVAYNGIGNRVMTSPNGITWTARTSAAENSWLSLTWAPELSTFVACANTGTGNRVMTSSATKTTTTIPSKTLQWNQGNLGINTTSPSNALHVVGDTRIEGNLTVNGTQTIVNTNVGTTEQLIITNDGTGPALVVNQTGSQPVLDVQDDGVSVLKILDGGNVGVGTTLPVAKFHVHGDARFQSPNGNTTNDIDIYSSADSVTRSYSGLKIWGNPVFSNGDNAVRNAARIYGGFINGGVNDWSNSFVTIAVAGATGNNGTLVDTLTVRQGNVGVGTTNPQAKLHVEGNLSLNGFLLPKYKEHDGIVYDPSIADGSSSARAGISALQLYLDGYGQSSGLKWLKCNGFTTQQVYCDFDTPNGPWTVPIYDKGADDISTLVRFRAFFVSRGIPNAGRGAGQTKDAWMSVKRTITTLNDSSYSYNGTRNGGPILTMPFYRTQTTIASYVYDWMEVCSPYILRELPPNVLGDTMSGGGTEQYGGWWNESAAAWVNSWRDGNFANYPDPEDWGWANYNSTSYPGIPFRICGIFK